MESLTRPISRRHVLKLAAALGLSFALPPLDLRSAHLRGTERKKSLIILWMNGGPSQLETWDPHPGSSTGGPTKAIKTVVPNLQIASHFPLMAEQLGEMSVIRSLVSEEGDHERGTYYLKTGHRPDPTLVHPSIGAIATRELPHGEEDFDIPMHVSLGDGQWPARGGFLGAEYDAFRVYDPGRNINNIRSPIDDPRRKEQRRKNLAVISQTFEQDRRFQVEKTLHQETIDKAFAMMNSEQLKAFYLDQEPLAVRKAYGDSSFGRGCLVARRLVETGVRAVEVTLSGFDTHVKNFESHEENAAILDPAFAMLIRDLKERDLLESTVVLCIGEFGRTPRVNPLDGRDHWPNGFSCVLGGGGLKKGLVIGETDPENTNPKIPPKDPIEIKHLYATILHVMGVDYAKEESTPIGRPMAFSSGTPIDRLL